jgi:hypothetical protein
MENEVKALKDKLEEQESFWREQLHKQSLVMNPMQENPSASAHESRDLDSNLEQKEERQSLTADADKAGESRLQEIGNTDQTRFRNPMIQEASTQIEKRISIHSEASERNIRSVTISNNIPFTSYACNNPFVMQNFSENSIFDTLCNLSFLFLI